MVAPMGAEECSVLLSAAGIVHRVATRPLTQPPSKVALMTGQPPVRKNAGPTHLAEENPARGRSRLSLAAACFDERRPGTTLGATCWGDA